MRPLLRWALPFVAPVLWCLLIGPVFAAPEPDPDEPATSTAETFNPYCLCFESEPAMDFGGRTVLSMQAAAGDLFSRMARERPGLAPTWEFPLAIGMMLVQHEVLGHGGRAREYGLGPSYGVGLDFSAYTTIARDPQTNEQNVLLAAGGSEATGMMAHRALLDLYQPGGGNGALLPLALLGKLDITLYISQTERPRSPAEDGGTFLEQFETGNDIAIYLVSRQGLRVDADPSEVWQRTYAIDFADPVLDASFDDARVAAVWNLLDPSLVMAVADYFRRHLNEGGAVYRPTAWKVHPRLALTAGTRAALGPGEISRFFDVYFVTDFGVGQVYIRDLDSSVDRSYGAGVGFHRWRVGPGLRLDLRADWWSDPRSLERPVRDNGWHAAAELGWLVRRGWGLSVKVGSKSDGFLPGTPGDDGPYLGFGLLYRHPGR